ncbi:alpha/beta hydrolase [Kribbella koreensis]|uniref:Alpha/beta hydrolase n=2 Tax=Kribbella TaxID=182639 RepID=A0ABP6W826_9ACTN
MPKMRNAVRGLIAVLAVGALGLTLTGGAGRSAAAVDDSSVVKPTIVLVHGAWADGSSWSAVTERLQGRGYRVMVEPNPLRGLATDSAYLAGYLSSISGPLVLVGHSYGGAVITNAATGNPNVKALVYIDAFMPDAAESVVQLAAAKPGSGVAVADPSTVFDFVPIPGGGGNVDLYVKQELFRQIFAADVRPGTAAVLAASQRPLAASALDEPSGTPAWVSIPSWALIGTADKVIPPAELEVMAARAKSHVVRIESSHLAMVSHPSDVTAIITTAAKTVR